MTVGGKLGRYKIPVRFGARGKREVRGKNYYRMRRRPGNYSLFDRFSLVIQFSIQIIIADLIHRCSR